MHSSLGLIRTCVVTIVAACCGLLHGCESSLSTQLAGRRCSKEGECLSGYVCASNNICELPMPDLKGYDAGDRTPWTDATPVDASTLHNTPDAGPATRLPLSGGAMDSGAPTETPVDCAAGLSNCDGRCVDDPRTNPQHCGACDGGCSVPANGSAVCTNGQCAIACSAGLASCSGACVNTATNKNHCGSCSNKCTKGETCTLSECE